MTVKSSLGILRFSGIVTLLSLQRSTTPPAYYGHVSGFYFWVLRV